MYQSSAPFNGLFRLKGKSRRTFDIIVSQNLRFLNFDLDGGVGAAQLPMLGCSPGPMDFFS
jgi:hypothetical protein